MLNSTNTMKRLLNWNLSVGRVSSSIPSSSSSFISSANFLSFSTSSSTKTNKDNIDPSIKTQRKKKNVPTNYIPMNGGSVSDFGVTATGRGEKSGNDTPRDVVHLYKNITNSPQATITRFAQREKSRKQFYKLEQKKFGKFKPEMKDITGTSMKSLGVGMTPGFLQKTEPNSLYQPRSRFRNRRERTVQGFTHQIKRIRDREDTKSKLHAPEPSKDTYKGFRSYLPEDLLQERKKKDGFEWTDQSDFIDYPELEMPLDSPDALKPPEVLRLPRPRDQELDVAGRSHGKGGRKTSEAEAWARPVKPGHFGSVTINNKQLQNYFSEIRQREVVLTPLIVTNTIGKFDIFCKVRGGGPTGQVGALRMAISNALQGFDPEFRPALKMGGYLERDNRQVERKKPGMKKARKRFQWSKR